MCLDLHCQGLFSMVSNSSIHFRKCGTHDGIQGAQEFVLLGIYSTLKLGTLTYKVTNFPPQRIRSSVDEESIKQLPKIDIQKEFANPSRLTALPVFPYKNFSTCTNQVLDCYFPVSYWQSVITLCGCIRCRKEFHVDQASEKIEKVMRWNAWGVVVKEQPSPLPGKDPDPKETILSRIVGRIRKATNSGSQPALCGACRSAGGKRMVSVHCSQHSSTQVFVCTEISC